MSRALPGNPGINNTAYLFFALVAAFLFFVTLRGDLGKWLGLLGLAGGTTASTAAPAATPNAAGAAPSAPALPSIPSVLGGAPISSSLGSNY